MNTSSRRDFLKNSTAAITASTMAAPLIVRGRAVGVISEDLGNMINTPIEAVGNVYLSSYSRDQETEADEFGMALAAKAGYDPATLVDALQGIERSAEFLSGEKREASFFDSHPTTPTSVADIK